MYHHDSARIDQTVTEMGALKTQVLENASTEKASTVQTFSQIKKVWYFTS